MYRTPATIVTALHLHAPPRSTTFGGGVSASPSPAARPAAAALRLRRPHGRGCPHPRYHDLRSTTRSYEDDVLWCLRRVSVRHDLAIAQGVLSHGAGLLEAALFDAEDGESGHVAMMATCRQFVESVVASPAARYAMCNSLHFECRASRLCRS